MSDWVKDIFGPSYLPIRSVEDVRIGDIVTMRCGAKLYVLYERTPDTFDVLFLNRLIRLKKVDLIGSRVYNTMVDSIRVRTVCDYEDELVDTAHYTAEGSLLSEAIRVFKEFERFVPWNHG